MEVFASFHDYYGFLFKIHKIFAWHQTRNIQCSCEGREDEQMYYNFVVMYNNFKIFSE